MLNPASSHAVRSFRNRSLTSLIQIAYSMSLRFVVVLSVLCAPALFGQEPVITSISPTSVFATGPDFTLTVNGSGFDVTCEVGMQFGSSGDLATTVMSESQITVLVPASRIASSAGLAPVTVSCSGKKSNAVNLTVAAPTPTLTSLSPSACPAATGHSNGVTIRGTGFLTNSVAYFNGTALSTTYYTPVGSGPSLNVTIPPALTANPGVGLITVVNPGNATPSNALTYTVAPPIALTSVEPSSVAMGGPDLVLTLNGSGFAPDAVALAGSAKLATTFVSSNRLTAVLPAAFTATAGQFDISVSSGGIGTTGLTFAVTGVTPVITSVAPTSVDASMSSGLGLWLYGSGFVSGAKVRWAGTLLYASLLGQEAGSTWAKAFVEIPTKLYGTAGAYAVAMVNPGGVASNEVTVYVAPAVGALTPSTVSAGAPDQTITATAYGVRSGSVVHLAPPGGGDLALATTVGNGTLSATVPAGALVSAGTAKIYVQDPSGVKSRTLDFVISPRPSISSISPQTSVQSSNRLTISVAGAGFYSGCAVQWNGAPISTTYIGSAQLNAYTEGALPNTAGAVSVSVICGGVASNSVTLTITPAPPVLSWFEPNTADVDGTSFTLTVSGERFVPGSVVFWDTTPLATAYLNAAKVTAQVPAALLLVAGHSHIKVVNPDGASTLAYVFYVVGRVTAVTPDTAAAGSSDLSVTVRGAGFAPSSLVSFRTSYETPPFQCATTYVDSHTVKAVIPAAAFREIGTALVEVSPIELAFPFTVTGTPVTISSLAPSSATLGGPGFTLMVSGSGFVSGSTVRWNSNPLATTFSNSRLLTANVPAALIAEVGNASVNVQNPNGLTTEWRLFSINGPAATVTSISPTLVAPGAPAFTLTVKGSQFYPGAAVTWDGGWLSTTLVSPTELRVTISRDMTAVPRVVQVGVQNYQAVASVNSLPLTIAGAATLRSMSKESATVGDAGFQLSVYGADLSSDSVLRWNGTPLATQFYYDRISADIPASFLATAGSVAITVTTGSYVSNTLSFTIKPRKATITALYPARVKAGGPAVTITIRGVDFAPGCSVTLSGTVLSSTYVSATTLTATIPQEFLSLYGSLIVVVTNPGALASGSSAFWVDPVLTALEPSEAATTTDNTTPVMVTVSGIGLKPGLSLTITNVNAGAAYDLGTTYVSPTQVKIALYSSYVLRSPGEWAITYDGYSSSSAYLRFGVSLPRIQSLDPVSVVAGTPSFTLTVNGSNFPPGSNVSVLWNGGALATTRVSATQLTATVPASLLTTPGSVAVTVFNGAYSKPAAVFTIAPAGASISSITPNRATAGDAGFTLSITGVGFASGAVAQWNGTALSTTFVSSTSLTAAVPAALIASAGNANITVLSAGLLSNPIAFTIAPATPVVTSLSPSHAAPGGEGFTLTVTGTGFSAATVARWNGGALATTFVNSGQLTAIVPAALIANAGTAGITVVAGSLTSNSMPFTIDAASAGPVATSEGIVNAASFVRSIAPGSFISIFGSAFALEEAVATGIPLPTVLKDVSVEIEGRAAPLLYVGPSQINAQVPFETSTGSATVVVRSGDLTSAPASIEVAATAPGVFQDASGHAIAQNQDWSLNTPAQGARPGECIVVYMNGQGIVDNPVPTGSAASSDPLSRPVATVQAKIGGKPADVDFAGLTPNLVGLFQVNLRVPDVPAGEQTLEVTVGANASNQTTVSIR
jgi:uncharacterized protein (TIGR03437 family)